MSKEQSDSDLLPYREVDRALKSKLPLLAGAMSAAQSPDQPAVTTQHALGSLLEFWDLCADPRELERVAAEALAAQQAPELVLPREEVVRKFRLASGKNVEPVDLVTLRFLEPRGTDSFRVRGMSRDFKPIMKRLRNREIAALGGKASAAKRLADKGTAQPTGGKGFRTRSESSSGDAQPEPSPEPKRNRTDNGSGSEPATEAEPKSSGQRSAVSDMSSSYDDDGAPPPPPPAVQFFEWFQAARTEGGWAREEFPPVEELDAFFASVGEALKDPLGATEALKVAAKGYAQDPFWLGRALPWAGFVEQWARHVRKPRRMLITEDEAASA